MNRPSESPAQLLTCAERAARAAGQHALHNMARRSEAVGVFKHDVKLALDLECQQTAETVIRAEYPAHPILGEESTGDVRTPGTEIEWIIDPIDGTVNFSHGLPFWCCSIAARQAGRTLAGVVFAPALGECYTAAEGQPACCNGTPLQVSAVDQLAASIILTGLDKSEDPNRPSFEVFRALSSRVQKARVMGVAALDICRVAAGQADGYFESGIYVWDIAAGELIVRQAGGRTEILESLGGHRLRFAASNGRIHEALTALLRDAIGLR